MTFGGKWLRILQRLVCLAFAWHAPAQIITTIAGADFAFPPTPIAALDAPLGNITGLATDDRGNVYIADDSNNLVFQVSPEGILNTIAGNGLCCTFGVGGPATSASLPGPSGLARDSRNNLYLTSSGGLYRISPDGIITTISGIPEGYRLFGIAADAQGNLYIADSIHSQIFEVSAGIAKVIAGGNGAGFSGDGGPASSASLNNPLSPAVDAAGNLYFIDADISNHNNTRIRKISGGIISTVTLPSGVFGGDARVLAFGPDGAMYLGFGPTLLKISGGVATPVTNGTPGYSGDGGPARNAQVQSVDAITFDAAGNMFLADAAASRVRKINPAGIITTVAGNGQFGFSGDGGAAIGGTFSYPNAVAADASGNVYVADLLENRVRKISRGVISTVAGNGTAGYSGDGGPATRAQLNGPYDVAADASGNIYIADGTRVRKVSGGIITTVAGNGAEAAFSGDGGPATAAALSAQNIAVDAGGNIYIAGSGDSRVRKISGGIITTIAGNGTAGFSGDGEQATAASLGFVSGLAVDASGALYISDLSNSRIRKIAGGIITTVAGNGSQSFSGDGGAATSASFFYNQKIAFSPNGDLYIVDNATNRIRRLSNGIITTAAGNGAAGSAGDGGLATSASVTKPLGVAVGPSGEVYIAENNTHRIREVLPAVPSVAALPASIGLTAPSGGAAAETNLLVATYQSVASNVAVSGMSYSVSMSGGDSWLSLANGPGFIGTPALVQLTADPTTVPPGNYQATLTINVPQAAPSVQTIAVNFAVTAAVPAALSLDRNKLSFTYADQSAARTQTVTVSNTGSGSLPFNVSVSLDSGTQVKWLSVSPAGGAATPNAPVALAVRADPAGLPDGTYAGTVLIASATSSVSVKVTMTVTNNPLILQLTQQGMTFTAVQSGGAIPAQTFAVLNLGAGSLNWATQTSTLSGGSWLSVDLQSGVSTAGPGGQAPVVTVTANPAGLAPGVYYGLVQVLASSAANSPQAVVAVLRVLPPGTSVAPLVQPASLVFSLLPGETSAGSQDIFIYDPTGTSKSFITFRDQSWILTLPGQATIFPAAPTRVVVVPGRLTPSTYSGNLFLQFSDGRVATIPVTYTATPASGSSLGSQAANGRPFAKDSTPACVPQKLLPSVSSFGRNFSVPAGYPQGLEVQVVDDCGSPHVSGSVVVQFSNGDPAVRLSSLNNGKWQGTWQASPQQNSELILTVTAQNAARNLTGTQQVVGALGSPEAAPAVSDGGVVSAASFTTQPVAPGELIAIFGNVLSSGASPAPSIPLPTQLASTTARIGGRMLPLIYSSESQVNAVVPFEVNANTNQQLLVQRGTTYATPVYIDVAAAAPAVFLYNNAGIIVDVKGNLIGPMNPAHAGDVVVVYCTGLGSVDAVVTDGAASPVGKAVNPVTVTIGGMGADLAYAGLTPSLVGLYQINLTIPDGVPTGDQVPIVVSVGGQTGPAASIAVR